MPITPNRSTLLRLNKTIKLAVAGHSLLKRKRDGLVQEFFKVLAQAKEYQSKLQENYQKAKAAINLARSVDGSAVVKSASFAHKEKAEIELEIRNHKPQDIEVRVMERFPDHAEHTILKNSHPYRKRSESVYEFTVPVRANETEKLVYRVKTKF